MSDSRTSKSLKNAGVTIFYYFVSVILGFWSRQVFYDYLGSEVLGLDTTASTMFMFLNLAELGIGSSVAYFMYRPMFENDTFTMNEIVALQGWIYRRVAAIILIGSFILMCFFPWIFSDIKIPLWYAYATFSIMLFGSMLGYFINYRQCVLNADQKGYKVTRVTQGAAVLFRILLIVLLPVVSHPFLLYLGTNVLGSIFGCLWLNHILKKEYPWLHKAEASGRELLKKYPEIITKTKQIFIHKVTTLIVNQVAPLIMYAFTTLSAVAYYGNYLTLIDKAKDVIKNAFSSTYAAVGNLVASHDDERIQSVFWELIDSRLNLSFSCILVLGMITEPFISVWLSPNYLLGKEVLILVCVLSFLSINRQTVDSFIAGYGLFQDIFAPAIEAVINLSVAIGLGYLWDIVGVQCGTLASTLIIVYGWKPYFLYTRGFNRNPWHEYFIPMLWRWSLLAVNGIVFFSLAEAFRPESLDNYISIGIYFVVLSIIVVPSIYIQFYFLTPGTRRFHARIVGLIRNKLQRH